MKIKTLLALLPVGIVSFAGATQHGSASHNPHQHDLSTMKEKIFLEINNEKIPNSVIERRLKTLPGIPALLSGQFQRDPLLVSLANQLLTENLLKEIAKSKNLYPTKEELAKRKAELEKQSPNIFKLLTEKGFKESELDEFLIIDLIQYKLLTHGVTITDKDVEEHYNKNTEEFTIPKKYELRLIAAKDDAAKKAIDAELAKKVPFAKVAESDLNSSPTKAKGGSIGEVPENVLPPDLKTAIASKKAGETTDWVKMGPSNTKLLVEKIVPESKKPLDADLKKQVHEQLMIERGQAKNNLEEMIREALNKAVIKYHEEFGKKEFEQLVEKQKVAKKPSVTVPHAPGHAHPHPHKHPAAPKAEPKKEDTKAKADCHPAPNPGKAK